MDEDDDGFINADDLLRTFKMCYLQSFDQTLELETIIQNLMSDNPEIDKSHAFTNFFSNKDIVLLLNSL